MSPHVNVKTSPPVTALWMALLAVLSGCFDIASPPTDPCSLGPGLCAPPSGETPGVPRTWTATTGMLGTSRENHTATSLPSGKVLVVGGSGVDAPRATAEVYDPATGTWSYTGSPELARGAHTATLLPSGKVLVVGGGGNNTRTGITAEVYDPGTGTWSRTGSLAKSRSSHTAPPSRRGGGEHGT